MAAAIQYISVLTVNVPDPAKPIIEHLAAMPEEEFEALRSALNTAPPSLRPEKFTGDAKALLLGRGPKVAELVEIITSLSRSHRDPSVTIEELSAGVAEEVLKRKGQPAADPTVLDLLQGRLTALLGIQSLKLYARASDVQHQYEELFFGARIVSDIRTVFEPDGTSPLGAMIVHNLKITSGHGFPHNHRDHFFALDNVDLDILQQVIQRAKDKTASLESIIKNQPNLTYFPSK